jgi:hypothetical protein
MRRGRLRIPSQAGNRPLPLRERATQRFNKSKLGEGAAAGAPQPNGSCPLPLRERATQR